LKICCTVCERSMDFTRDESTWVTVPVADDTAYACSSLCALRLGHALAKETYKETARSVGVDLPSIPPPCVTRQDVVN